jgi:hypothetical protein
MEALERLGTGLGLGDTEADAGFTD